MRYTSNEQCTSNVDVKFEYVVNFLCDAEQKDDYKLNEYTF